ncbi:hypothetical protein Hdeb2414_s0015g00446941 [Helianthus debilis subsp. tardiflorus]
MEPYDFVHSIKAEKANVLAQYKLFTNITKVVQFMEAFVAVGLISWSSTLLPSVFKLSGEYLLAFTSYLMNQHVVFLVGNLIVFVCYVLSRFTDSGNAESGVSGIQYDHVRDDQLTIRNPKPAQLQVTETPVERQIMMIPNEKAIIETERVTKPELEAVTAIKQAEKQIERFRRTQSDLKSKISVKSQPELQRSVTERRRRRRSMTVASGELESTIKSFKAVDELSNEEFRIAVETFISKQQKILKQQNMVEVW